MKAFEIFKTGKHTSDKGITRDYTTDDLDKIVSQYNPEENEAPIVIGHPQTNAPAFGWIEKLERVGEKLIAIPKQVNDAFSQMVKDGSFKKRSVSLTPDLKLNHVGFLGAVAPAVKGLKDIEFSDDAEFSVFEFDADLPAVTHLPEAEAGFAPPKSGDQSAPSNQSDNLPNKNTVPSLVQNSRLDNLQAQIDSLGALTQTFAEASLNQEELLKINNSISELRFSIQTNEFELMLNEKLAYGSVTPAMKTKIMKLLEFLQNQNFSSSDFSSNDFTNNVKSHLTEFLDSIPKIILYDDFAEKADNERVDLEFAEFELDPESVAFNKKAIALSKSEKISYVEAVTRLAQGE